MTNQLELTNHKFKDLFTSQGLLNLDDDFYHTLTPNLQHFLQQYRKNPVFYPDTQTSELLIEIAKRLESFLINLFKLTTPANQAQSKTLSHNPISIFKKHFIHQRAKKKLKTSADIPPFNQLNSWLETELSQASIQTNDKELAVALLAQQYTTYPEKFSSEIKKLTQWCIQALTSADGKLAIKDWISFKFPEKLDPNNLVKCSISHKDPLKRIEATKLTHRDGFELTDYRMNAREIQNEVNYCIYCHDHSGDFCSKGFPTKKKNPELGFRKNYAEVTLTGCPLDEKISEMHLLKRDGFTIAALAMIMADNPMCPATGHRICNDCMKACIYQKQEPVNIPQIETRVLTDVLNLPWGVEVYDLLTRWNPLRDKQWLMKPYNGLKILIAGMGPAGFTLAHHMLQEGFAVVGFDGLKIEPFPKNLIENPIYSFSDIKEPLDTRQVSGFGGVAEYGITVRWDKNFLKLIQLSLLRKPYFQVFGNTRFGGSVTVEKAYSLGFDHLALAVGAGLPKALPVPNSLAPGMRQANDFLMALQLGEADRENSITGLQIRLPAVVIGGGLTSVDTATEVQAYYIRQVENTLKKYEKLSKDEIYSELDTNSQEILNTFLEHGRKVREERKKPKPNFIQLIRNWGGVTIVYRRTMQESPAWINNHEELNKALQEGIYYLESLQPTKVELDKHGHTKSLVCKNTQKNIHETIKLAARSILVATGTKPNIAYEFEHQGTFQRNGLQYQHYELIDNKLKTAHGSIHCKDPHFGPFTSWNKKNKFVSLIGDSHPVFHGSVVKAIASAMRTWPKITATLNEFLHKTGDQDEYRKFANYMQKQFSATIKNISRPTPNIIELTIHAPLAADSFKPGHFYKLQSFSHYAPKINGIKLQMEAIALTASKVNKEQGTINFIIFKSGASSLLCDYFKIGTPVSLMGPTGVRAKVSKTQETVLVIGGIRSIPFLQSYSTALMAEGNRVLYVADIDSQDMLFYQKIIEKITSQIIWCSLTKKNIQLKREQDLYLSGFDAVDALLSYSDEIQNILNKNYIPLSDIDRVYIIADRPILKKFQLERDERLKPLLTQNPKVSASVYSTMQCMLKGVCAQCLQWQIDPESGQRTKAVFACSWPEQPLELIDFKNIDERQSQNIVTETLNKLTIAKITNQE